MNFSELHELVPFARYGKAKSLSMSPFNGIDLLLPGRHAEDTSPKGGDFCVCVSDEKMKWTRHQFTHTDIFRDIEKKQKADKCLVQDLIADYVDIVHNDTHVPVWDNRKGLPGLHPQTFLYGVLCLAVAEHRRYAHFEKKFGGRYLPLRFAAGISEGRWDASQAAEKQRRGRPGVEWLEKDHGVPGATQDLMGS